MLATYHCPLFQLLLLLLLGKASCLRQLASSFGPLHLVLSVLSVTERKQRKQRIKQRGNGEQLLWHVRRRISQPILFPLHWLIICTVSSFALSLVVLIRKWPISGRFNGRSAAVVVLFPVVLFFIFGFRLDCSASVVIVKHTLLLSGLFNCAALFSFLSSFLFFSFCLSFVTDRRLCSQGQQQHHLFSSC